jgi:GH24 family phage-related lysozyme (muramidase)
VSANLADVDLSAKLVEEEEGESSPLVYFDSRGLATIARGCLVDPKAPHAAGLCDLARAAQDAHSLNSAKVLAAQLPGYFQCSDVRKAVLTSMCYQLGNLSGWPDFRTALSTGDYDECATQMLWDDFGTPTQRPSAWHNETPRRCERAAWMMKKNVWLNHGDPIPSGGAPA